MKGEKLFILYKDSNNSVKERCRIDKWTFQDRIMGEQCITFSTECEKPIPFAIGDYCTYRGATFYLNNLPSVSQTAKRNQIGNAFKYENVKFESEASDLGRVIMLDVTPTTGDYIPSEGTNYTGSANFQLFCGETNALINGKSVTYTPVCTLAGKIQANLDRAFPKAGWHIHVNLSSTEKKKGKTWLVTHTDDKVLSFNNTTVQAALSEVHNTFKLDYFIRGREIYIGYSLGAVTSDQTTIDETSANKKYFYFGYGRGYADKDNQGLALFQIKETSNQQQQLITRLRAIGSTKNMPYRYYNKKYNLSQSLFPQNLQLPDTFEAPNIKDKNNISRKKLFPFLCAVLGDTSDAYIDKNDDCMSTKEGLREGFAQWDGSNADLEEIYPTIKESTYGELRAADCEDIDGRTESKGTVSDALGHKSFLNYDDHERIDEIVSVGYLADGKIIDDANIGDGIVPNGNGDHPHIDLDAVINENTKNGQYINSVGKHCWIEEKDLFTVKDQDAGSYFMSPSYGHLWCGVKYSTSHNSEIEIGYRIKVYITPKSKNKEVLAGTYSHIVGNIKNGDSDFIEFELPDLPDVKSSKSQIERIKLDEKSDVRVTFELIFTKKDYAGLDYSITYYVGKSKYEKGLSTDFKPQYRWANAQYSETFDKSPFHVIIKDLGIQDFKATFSGKDKPAIVMSDGHCVARTFEIGDDVKKVTFLKNGREYAGWQLSLTRATDSSLHIYYPSTNGRLKAGDHYVLTGIVMPDVYIKAAEVRLLVAATQYLADNSETKFTYEPHIDEIYLIRNYDRCENEGDVTKSVYWNLYAGLKFPFLSIPKTEDSTEIPPVVNITIETLTIKEGDSLAPKVEITLNNDIEQSTYQKITTAVNRIYDGSIFKAQHANSGSILSEVQLLINQICDKKYLSKLTSDTADGLITFLKGVKFGEKYGISDTGRAELDRVDVGHFVERVSGGVMRMDAEGHSYVEVDKLYVRMKAYFDSLEIIKFLYSYGNRIAGRGGVRISKVEDKGAFYRCYFLQEQDGIKIRNPFVVKDQAIAKDFNIKEGTTEHASNHYLWRAVTSIGDNYVDLSKTNCDAGSDAPLVGDSLCQFGYQGTDKENRDRQNAIMESVVGSGTPSYVLLHGINTFSLDGKDIISMGFDETNNEAYLRTYGNAYIGARDGSSYIKYSKSGLEAKLAKLDMVVGGQSQSLDKYIEEHSAAGQSVALWKIIPSAGAISDLGGKLSFKVQKIADGVAQTFSEQYLLNVEKCGLYAYDGTDDYSTPGKSLNVGVEYPIADLYKSAKYLNIVLKSGIGNKVLATLTLNEAGKVTIPDVYSIVTSKRAIDNASDLLTVTVKKNDSSITSQAALQAEGLALYAYDGIDDFSSAGKPVTCGSAVRIYDLYKSGKYLNLVLKKGSKIVDVKTLLPVGKSAKVYQYWLDPPVLTVTSDEWGVVQQKGAVAKLYVRNADGTAAHIKVVKYYQSSVYDAGGDCEFVYDFTTYDQGVCEIRVTAMKTLYDSTADMRYPVPTASVRMEIEMQDGTKLNTTLTVNVDYSKTSVRFKILEDRVKSTVASVNEKLKSVSKIEQKANEIDLRVRSMGVGRNLLKDTEFTELKNVTGGVSLIADDTKKHGGAGGIYINGVGNTSFTGFGFRYKARVEPGTNYIGSVWVMTENASSIDNGLFIEFQSNRDGKGTARDHISTSRIQPSGGGVWERFEFVVTTPANCKQMEMNVYLAQNGVLYLSEPQLERQLKAGDKASPWSPYGGLREAGLNLRDGTFTATGENFLFKLANGTTVLAINEQGKLKAELIEAQEITGEMIAQPFRTYNTGKEFATGKSFSWRITQSYAEFGIITFSSRFDGSNINIYNDTDTEVSLSLLLMREGLQRIVIPARMMLRAQGILHIASNSTRWYMLCPYEAISGGVRLVDFKKS